MTYLEKYRQIYGEDMEDDVLFDKKCPGYFREIRDVDAEAPYFLNFDSCCGCDSCKDCWNKEMEADHEEAN